MATSLHTPPSAHSPQTVDSSHAPRQPVLGFATLGALILIVNTILVLAWIAGPDFKRVAQGPDELPGWMATVLDVSQIALPLLALAVIYWLLVRPWIRQRRITYDGLICLAGMSLSVWDVFSSGAQPWFAYNSHLLNWGNPMSALPGWLSLNEPGHSLAWSFPVLPALYTVIFPLMGYYGCAVLRGLKKLFPDITRVGMVFGLIAGMIIFELIFEGILFLPLGFWCYPGGYWPVLFGGHYYQLPLNELIGATANFTAITFLRYSIDENGETIVERGVQHIGGGAIRKAALRLLALVAAVHLSAFTFYHLPETFWRLNSHSWPKDVTDRSYFQNQCGATVDRACPGPNVPIYRPGSGYINWEGTYTPPSK